MEFLTPMTAVYAAAATVPPLVLLYFLKLKRREQVISSTLLWKRAVQDLQVNAPFQRLRRNLLLLLQLLILAAILLALGAPVASLTGGGGRRYVMLIDRSASMNATDVAGGRLAAAKEQARTFVRSLREKTAFALRERSDQAMVIAFDNHAKVMCTFTSNRAQLLAAIDAVEATDCGSSLAEAVTVARAFATPAGDEANGRSAETRAQLVLFSDGKVHDADQIVVGEDELQFHRVGATAENVAVTAMQARRSYEKADAVDVFASLANYGREAVECDVQLTVDGNVRSVRKVRIPARQPAGPDGPAAPGKIGVSFALAHAGAGVVEVRQLRPDPLASDDAAWEVLPPPKRLSVLLVTQGNRALRNALNACPIAKLDVRSPQQFDTMDHAAMSVQPLYDVIVLDGHAPAKLPRGRYMVFGRPPGEAGVGVKGTCKNQITVDWRARHPVLTHVNLTNVFASRCWRLELPRDAVVLSEFNDTPALALVRTRGSVFLLASFDVTESNWPFEPGFVLFCYNAVQFLGLEEAQAERASLRTGAAISVKGPPGGPPATVSGPGMAGREIAPDAAGVYRCPAAVRAGVYRFALPGRADRQFAVNLLDPAESDIQPAAEMVLSGQTIEVQAGPTRQTNVQLWPYLGLLALVLVCVEWFVYNRKVRM